MSRKITFILIALSSLFIGGCTTPYDLKKSKPKISYVSTKPAVEVKKCILKKWQSHLTNVTEEKMGNGWLIRHNDVLPAATVAIVTIDDEGGEVKVNYYHRTNRIKIHRLEEEVNACQ